MRHARYSARPHHAVDWGGGLRALLVVVVIGLLGYWLVTGPAVDWLSSLSDWLRDL